jgi:hypothetical protein
LYSILKVDRFIQRRRHGSASANGYAVAFIASELPLFEPPNYIRWTLHSCFHDAYQIFNFSL